MENLEEILENSQRTCRMNPKVFLETFLEESSELFVMESLMEFLGGKSKKISDND